jgi:hypothetical protein
MPLAYGGDCGSLYLLGNTQRKEANKMRSSINTKENGYDSDNQAWYQNGVYVRCGHPDSMACDCFGRINEGKAVI